jgi:hypothetical protein
MTSPTEVPDTTPESEPAPKKARGGNKGMTKESNPKLSQRLPRERGALVAAIGDGLSPFERALVILGDRVKCTRMYYTLDGKPCNASDLMVAAGIKV